MPDEEAVPGTRGMSADVVVCAAGPRECEGGRGWYLPDEGAVGVVLVSASKEDPSN